jgi:hypothetical protein
MNIEMSRFTLRECSLALTHGHTLCSLDRSFGCAFSRKPHARVSLRREHLAFRCTMRVCTNTDEYL